MTTDLAELFDRLIRFETELWAAVDTRLRQDHDLVLSWFEPMLVMDRTENCRVQDIAVALSITVGGVSKLVDRIERARYCRRRANPDDRRSSLLELTPRGRRVLRRASRSVDAVLHDRLAGPVTDAELRQFSHTLGRLRTANLAATSTERSA